MLLAIMSSRKTRDLGVRLKRARTVLNLKEEVGQMLSNCPTTSNSCNVDSLVICASRGFIVPLTGFSRLGLKARYSLEETS